MNQSNHQRIFKHKPPFAKHLCKPLRKGGEINGSQYRRLRIVQLMMHPQCAVCGAPADEVHHIIPRHVRPDLTKSFDNMQSVCRKCHQDKHLNA